MRLTDPTRVIRKQGPAHVTPPYQPESPTNSSFYPARNELWVIPGFELLGRVNYTKMTRFISILNGFSAEPNR